MSAITEKSELPYYEAGTEEDHDDEDSHPHEEDEGKNLALPTWITTNAGNIAKYALFAGCAVGLIYLFGSRSGHKHKSAVRA